MELIMDGCEMRQNLNHELVASLPDGAFVRSLWVSQRNAFMHIAATKAEILWQGEEIVYRQQREHYRSGEAIDLR
jgi:hypothetical protein